MTFADFNRQSEELLARAVEALSLLERLGFAELVSLQGSSVESGLWVKTFPFAEVYVHGVARLRLLLVVCLSHGEVLFLFLWLSGWQVVDVGWQTQRFKKLFLQKFLRIWSTYFKLRFVLLTAVLDFNLASCLVEVRHVLRSTDRADRLRVRHGWANVAGLERQIVLRES